MSENEKTLRRVADTLLDLRYDTWNFGDSVAFEGMLAATEALGDERWAAFAHGWARGWANRATPYRRLDCTAPGLAMVRLARRYDDGQLLAAAAGLGDYLLGRSTLDGVFETWEHSPLMHPYGPARLAGRGAALVADPPPGVFVDCLHFDPPFLVGLGAAVDEERFWRAGLAQAEGYVRLLQRDDGLFEHFVLRGAPDTYGPGWGRGQGWALLGLLDVIEESQHLTLDEAARASVEQLRASAARLIEAMVALQRTDGHWWAVVTDDASGDEYSTAAFMAAGFARAVRLGVASDPAIIAAGQRAARATIDVVDADGTLREVSAAVMACTEASHYAHVPRGFLVPWGQGPVVLALAEERIKR